MVALVFMIIAIVLTFGLVGYGVYKVVSLVKSPTPRAINYPSEVKKLIYFSVATSIATLLIFVFLSLYQKYSLTPLEWSGVIFGSLLFGLGLSSGVYAFIMHYYGKEVPEILNKWLFRSIFFALTAIALGLLLLTNGIANHIDYPLTNGINFQEGFVYPGGNKPNLAWYAICILAGAILVYVICDHRFYVEYGKHGILESTFFVAFPAGIIGARLGYVIGEWNHSVEGGLSFAERVAAGQWWAPIAIWEGGLTVISGALVGIVVGVIWFVLINRKYSIWIAVDAIVPCILVAQAVGRWGNFFNAEVHGYQVLKDNWWFLPKIVANNAAISESSGPANPGYIYMPLFYIEFLSNLAGYFILRFAIEKGLRKYIEFGDLAFGYIVWYGLTRVIMEPLRDSAYNMGQDGYYSWIWSICFVLIGTGAIFVNHMVRFIIRTQKNDSNFKKTSLLGSSIVTGTLFAGALALIIVGASMMIGTTQDASIKFDRFNNGLIVLVIGLAVLLIFGCAIFYLIQVIKKYKYAEK